MPESEIDQALERLRAQLVPLIGFGYREIVALTSNEAVAIEAHIAERARENARLRELLREAQDLAKGLASLRGGTKAGKSATYQLITRIEAELTQAKEKTNGNS